MPRYILITGSRDWTHRPTILLQLVQALDNRPPHECLLIEGGARGADRLGRSCAIELGMPYETIEADWDTYGKRAGPIRNQAMIDRVPREDRPHAVCIAFPLPQSIGTFDMMKKCRAAGIDVRSISIVRQS